MYVQFQAVFQRRCISLHSQQQSIKFPIANFFLNQYVVFFISLLKISHSGAYIDITYCDFTDYDGN